MLSQQEQQATAAKLKQSTEGKWVDLSLIRLELGLEVEGLEMNNAGSNTSSSKKTHTGLANQQEMLNYASPVPSASTHRCESESIFYFH